ncbi:MAG: PHP domain-containing protein [Aquisalimonadaceae bacterium]
MDVFSPIDLHCHSTASDGTLAPAEVVARAAEKGVRVLALTDHDTVAGLGEAENAAHALNIHLIPGAELSCAWEGRDLHVVALGIDRADAMLLAALAEIRSMRERRLQRMAEKLEKRGIPGMAEAVQGRSAISMPTRTHLARALLDAGRVRTLQEAFDRYLQPGKPAWVKAEWPEMEAVVRLIHAVGGRAVLAHPLAYGMTGAWLRRTLTAFRETGGDAVEVVCGNTDRQRVDTALGQTLRAGLQGSVGSDFHGPANPWIELGRLRPLPAAVTPVWKNWNDVEKRLTN